MAVETPTRSSHLFEQIHDILWKRILDGEIKPGQRMKDVEWAAKLGVSRTPVREAMRKMQQEGILVLLDHGGYEVRSVSRSDDYALYRCRSALEGQAMRDAAEHFGPKAAKKFEKILNSTDDAIERADFGQVFEINGRFHRELIKESNNSHLISLCESISKIVLFYRTVFHNRIKFDEKQKGEYIEYLKNVQRYHRSIIDALIDKDGERAAQLMQEHLQNFNSFDTLMPDF